MFRLSQVFKYRFVCSIFSDIIYGVISITFILSSISYFFKSRFRNGLEIKVNAMYKLFTSMFNESSPEFSMHACLPTFSHAQGGVSRSQSGRFLRD